MILNTSAHCPLPSARLWFAALGSIAANAFFLLALRQGAEALRWL